MELKLKRPRGHPHPPLCQNCSLRPRFNVENTPRDIFPPALIFRLLLIYQVKKREKPDERKKERKEEDKQNNMELPMPRELWRKRVG